MIKKTILIATVILLVSACGSEPSEDEKTEEILSDIGKKPTVSISKEVINEMIQTLPQPIEIANIITDSKVPFSKESLLPSSQAKNYSDKYVQSMAFGAYGADLGYINLNDKTLYTLEYLESLSELANKLQVNQFFDFALLADITNNRNNADSLIHISTRNFNKIDDYLKEQNRGEQSVLILIGSWIEGMHIFSDMNEKKPSDEIMKRMAQQKVVFENICLILSKLKEIEHFNNLKTDFDNIKKTFDNVKITYEFQPPETKEVNGELVIVDKSKTNVDYKPETIKELSALLSALRNKYLLAKN